MFVPPYTQIAVFIDNYHENYGASGVRNNSLPCSIYDRLHTAQVNLQNGAPGTAYQYTDRFGLYVFGTEYDLATNKVRALKPKSNTFCSAGAFFPDGTLLNVAGAEPNGAVQDGFAAIGTYAPGPCTGSCAMDWVEKTAKLQHKRWYPSTQTLVDGSIVIVGGSDVGGLVLNEANINVPTYELLYSDGRATSAPVTLPILQFTDAQNLVPDFSYNLYPIRKTLSIDQEVNRQ